VQCTLVQSSVSRSHVVRLSVCPSVTLVDCDHIAIGHVTDDVTCFKRGQHKAVVKFSPLLTNKGSGSECYAKKVTCNIQRGSGIDTSLRERISSE